MSILEGDLGVINSTARKPKRKRRNYVAELNALQGRVKTVLKILGCVEGDLPANVVAIVKGCLEGE